MCLYHLPHPLGSRGAAELLRLPPTQKISIDLVLQRAPCLMPVC